MTKILAIQGSNLKKVNIKTDTTILLATEAQKRGYKIYYFEPENLSFLNGKVLASCKHIKINENDTVETLKNRLQVIEHRLYSDTIKYILIKN